jgi:Ca2+-binding RTX toxin-like protein
MTTGTSGNDFLTNDQSVKDDYIDGLGGDDTVDLFTFNLYPFDHASVHVDGGDGFDTLILDGTYNFYYPSAGGGTVEWMYVPLDYDDFVYFTAIEKLVMHGEFRSGFSGADGTVTTGDWIDELYLGGNVKLTVSTLGGDDSVRISNAVNGSGADGGSGNDLIDLSGFGGDLGWATGGSGDDRLVGSLKRDTLNGGDGNDMIDALGGDDTIDGGAGDDILIGGSGNDTIRGGTGYDVMIGGAGNDVYFFDLGKVVIEEVGDGIDTILSLIATGSLAANVENFTLLEGALGTVVYGNNLSNVLTGNSAGNEIVGNGGDDTINGGAGADRMSGGLGNDTYYVGDAGDAVSERVGEGTDTVRSSVTYTLPANVERLFLTGAAAIDGTGNALDNVLTGNDGANTLTGGAGMDTLSGGLGADTMIGGADNDLYVVDNAGDSVVELAGGGNDTVQSTIGFTLAANVENLELKGIANVSGTGNTLDNRITGNSGNNALNGGGGNDRLDGGLGHDAMAGGTGNDTYFVDSAGDVVTEAAGEGTDMVNAAVSYTLGANVENLFLTGTGNINGTGNALDNQLYGNAGNNVLDGGAGSDLMTGGAGDDIYIVDSLGDRARELDASGGSADLVRSAVSFVLGANVENLVLTGSAASFGWGNALANTITGNGANNVLKGLGGADTLEGGGGNDSFAYASTADSTASAFDKILSFSAGDRIDVSAIDARSATAGNDAFAFVGSAAFSGAAGELRAFQSGGLWIVQADTDGDKAADLVIQVSSDHALAAADFVV